MNKLLPITNTYLSVFLRRKAGFTKITLLFWGLLLIIPVFIYIVTIFENAYNFPYEDDFISALLFVYNFAFNHTQFSERIDLLFSQYNEHRIVLDRLVFLGDYYLFGTLNFRYLTLFGNTAVLLLAFLFIKLSFRAYPWHQRLFYLVPVAYSLFSFQYWELTTWSMAVLSNLYTEVFALISLYQLCRSGKYAFLLACIAATLATFTNGNGMFCFVAGVPLLILLKNYRRLWIWSAAGAVTILFYFKGYFRPPNHPDITDTLLNHTGQAIRYFFLLLGGFSLRPTVSLFFGLVMFFTAIFLVLYRWRTQQLTDNLPLVGLLLFLYLTCLSITAGRAGFGVLQAHSTRYGFIIVTLYATQAVLAIEMVRNYYLRTRVALGYGILAILLFVSGTNTVYRENIKQRSAQLHQIAIQYQKNPNTTRLPFKWDYKLAKTIFDDATAKGIFQMDKELK